MIEQEGKERLILVPCHSIWKQSLTIKNEENLGQLPEHWHLAPFQLEGKDHLAFIRHAIFGVKELLKALNNSILVFSGGETKEDAGPVSEAYSYYALALKLLSWVEAGKALPAELEADPEIGQTCCDIVHTAQEIYKVTIKCLFATHVSTEIFALDSFENLLFSIGRFHELCLVYPTSITIVGFGFKEKRYIEYHAKAIDYPVDQITYVAKDPTPECSNASELEDYFKQLGELENKNALRLFSCDWYGRKGNLYAKKQSRNPFKRKYNYSLPLKHLKDPSFSTDDDEEYFSGSIKRKMPWSSISTTNI